MSLVSPVRPTRDCAPRLTDFDAERASYRIEVPERFNAVLDIVEAWASEDPDALAVLSVDEVGEIVAEQSAADLARASREAARVLLDLGVGKGDHVFVMLPRIAEWYAALLGAMRIGAIPMPGPNLLTSKDIAYRFEQTGATAVITDEAGTSKVDQAGTNLATRLCVGDAPQGWMSFAERCDAVGDGETPTDPTDRDDPLLLYFTSGTVSYPKIVQQSQSYALGHIGTARFWHDLRARRRALDGHRHRLGEGSLGWLVWADARAGGDPQCRAWSTRHRHDLRHPRPSSCHVVLRAADAVPAAGPGRLFRARPVGAAALHERRRAAQPRGDPGVARGHGWADDLRRLWADGDDMPGRELPRDGASPRDRWAALCPATTSRSSTTMANRCQSVRSEISSCAASPTVPSGCSPATTTTRRHGPGVPWTVLFHRRQGQQWTTTDTSGSRAATMT